MKARINKVTEIEESIKEECKTFGKQHGWLWFSIVVLLIGQVLSFVYLIHSQKSLSEDFKKGATCCSGSVSGDLSFDLLTNSSINREQLATADKLEFISSEPSQQDETLRRSRRSASGKPHRHSNKVSSVNG